MPLAAIVLLELDDVAVGELALEFEDVLGRGTAEGVDRLIVVPDRKDGVLAFRRAA